MPASATDLLRRQTDLLRTLTTYDAELYCTLAQLQDQKMAKSRSLVKDSNEGPYLNLAMAEINPGYGVFKSSSTISFVSLSLFTTPLSCEPVN